MGPISYLIQLQNGVSVRRHLDHVRQRTAALTRNDDPDYEHTATWTMKRAEQAGLAGKGPWRQYPQAMLTARAISEVVRTAASDVLLGAAYTPEELGHTIEGEVL